MGFEGGGQGTDIKKQGNIRIEYCTKYRVMTGLMLHTIRIHATNIEYHPKIFQVTTSIMHIKYVILHMYWAPVQL